MNGIFGPNTQVVLAFLTRLPDLSAEDIGRVTNAWKQTESRDHAEAWVEVHRATTHGERYGILAAASVARQTALDMAGHGHEPEWEFRAAASDAAAALAAGQRIGSHYDTLISPLAAVMPWLPPTHEAAGNGEDVPDSDRPPGGLLRQDA
jgi:hypothetical protein